MLVLVIFSLKHFCSQVVPFVLFKGSSEATSKLLEIQTQNCKFDYFIIRFETRLIGQRILISLPDLPDDLSSL